MCRQCAAGHAVTKEELNLGVEFRVLLVDLFGSYAKGTAREQSDIAILLEHELGWRERNSILNRLYRAERV